MTNSDSNSRKNKMVKKRGFVPRKKRSGGGGRQDDDLDSRGNIKGLIDYEYDSEDTFDVETSDTDFTETTDTKTTPKSPIARRTRNAKKQAQKAKKQPSKRRTVVSSDEEDSSSSEDEKESKLVAKLRDEKRRLQKKLAERKRYESDSSSDESSSSEEESIAPRRKSKHRRLRRIQESETESESELSDEDEYSDRTDDEEDEEDEEGTVEETEEEEDDEEEDDDQPRAGGITLSFGIDEGAERMIPRRHNMKKESAQVRKFVKLVTTPSDEDTIDGQIDQFKALPEEQRAKLITVLENRNKTPGQGNSQQGLMFKILTMNLPAETQSLVLSKYNSLQTLDPGSSEYYKMRNWLDKLTSMPLGIYKEIPVKIADGQETCGAFMEKARKCLDDAIYGQEESKLQILQFIATKIANPTSRGLSLLLSGPPGIGKTSLIKNGIAKALQWPFQFISLGGDSDASTYTGHQLVYEGSHCGKIVNSLCAAKSMSMVLMFDEVDKISSTSKGEEVQNLLVHLTDPVQNSEFEDKYLSGIPIDLSRVMFTFSANYLEKIDKVLLDRMLVVNLQGYNAKEKAAIAEQYLLPAALKEVDLAEKVGISKEIIQYIIENYASEEVGVRELKRCLEQIAQKVNMLRMFNSKQLPFHIKDFSLPFVIKKEHIDLFLKKKQKTFDESALRMYS
jgi:hypothetical protein